SIDHYSGPMSLYPLASSLIEDPELKARLGRHMGCFLKRLRIVRIINLSRSAQLQAELARYLNSGVTLDLDPDAPDLTKIDEVWGFYLPSYNSQSAANYPRACPERLASEPAPEEVIDALAPDFVGKLATFVARQAQVGGADAMDFVFYPSVRSSDAVLMLSWALAAYHLTGDIDYLRWRDLIVDLRANAGAVARTMGAFKLPKACT